MSAKMTPIDARATMILILGASLPAWAYSFAGGTGEPNDPYQIATAEQLVSIGSDPNLLDKHFALLNDIDLDPNLPGGRAFTAAVIAPRQGAYLWQGVPFTGVFDGCSHSIKNLTFQRSATLPISDFVALFGNVARGAVVSDLKVENANFQQQDGYFVGVLVDAGLPAQFPAISLSGFWRVTTGARSSIVGQKEMLPANPMSEDWWASTATGSF